MIKINTCRKCRNLFEANVAKEICPQCERRLEIKFKEVRTYIRKNHGAGLEEVSSECRVQTGQLLRWIREERLFFDESADVALPCLNCGELIKIGKYCPKCKSEMKRNLKSALKEVDSRKTEISNVVACRSALRSRSTR